MHANGDSEPEVEKLTAAANTEFKRKTRELFSVCGLLKVILSSLIRRLCIEIPGN